MRKRHPTEPGRHIIDPPASRNMSLKERAFQMWAVHPKDLDEMGLTREQFFLAHLKQVRNQAIYIAEHACLVEPDGGEPDEKETEVCERVAARIREHIR